MSIGTSNSTGRPATTSWYPAEAVAVHSFDLDPPVTLLDVDYVSAANEPIECNVESIPIPRLSQTQVVRVPIPRPPRPRVREFLFTSFDKLGDEKENIPAWSIRSGGLRFEGAVRPESTTRIRPPKDVIKLEDRLQYILQPPLESFLSERQLSFPFKPFPYQYEGISFLYPRHSAILADEMGLGKTMQAITTIRPLSSLRVLTH